jgi:hypothetical protein
MSDVEPILTNLIEVKEDIELAYCLEPSALRISGRLDLLTIRDLLLAFDLEICNDSP